MKEKSVSFKKIALWAGRGFAVLLLAVLLWRLTPWFLSLSTEEGRLAFQAFLDSLGVWGVFVMLGVQILQVVVAVFPGEPVEVLAGMIYGTWGGLLICLLGLLAGTAVIFFTVRRLGRSFVEKLFAKEKLQRLRFLQDTKKLELIIFLLFFIPGTPKDMLTYAAGLTPIRTRDFFLIATLARIPSVVSSTFAGGALARGEYWKMLLVFLFTGALGVLGIIYNNRLLDYLEKRRQEKRKKRLEP
ncbi:MAG: VTT domain-containing protein [Oscillospiraceae bacterium]|nr:VTT domain-containing protein [Oscillospiraceae bacterium]